MEILDLRTLQVKMTSNMLISIWRSNTIQTLILQRRLLTNSPKLIQLTRHSPTRTKEERMTKQAKFKMKTFKTTMSSLIRFKRANEPIRAWRIFTKNFGICSMMIISSMGVADVLSSNGQLILKSSKGKKSKDSRAMRRVSEAMTSS